jgi:hypothetical protein
MILNKKKDNLKIVIKIKEKIAFSDPSYSIVYQQGGKRNAQPSRPISFGINF